MDSNAADLDTFPKWLRHHARSRPDAPALREKRRGIWQTQGWRAFEDEVRALAAALLDDGFQRGDCVALLGDNRPRLQAALCATQWLGGVAVPLYQDVPAADLLQPLRLCGASHVFAEDQEQVDKLLALLPQLPALQRVVYDADRGMRHYRQPQLESHAACLTRGRRCLTKDAARVDAEAARGRRGDPAAMFFPRPGEGAVRGVVLTHGALIDRARAGAQVEGLTADDCAVAYLPPAWIGQHMFGYAQPLVVGYCVCCPESSETMLADMREVGPTYFFAPPRVLQTLVADVAARMQDAGAWKRALYERAISLAHRVGPQALNGQAVALGDRVLYGLGDWLMFGPLRDVLGMSRLRVAYTSGGAIAGEVLAFFHALGVNLKQLYGSAEAGVFVSVQPDGQLRPDTVGRAAPGVELAFSPQRELLIRSPGLFAGYHGDDAATRDAVDAEGWYHTGDAGYVGDDGHLRILDRVDDLGALADGTLFAPGFIERRLLAHPCVRAALAIGHRRAFVSVLVELDMAALARRAAARGELLPPPQRLAADASVRTLVAECIAQVNADLGAEPLLAGAPVRRFVVLPQGLEPDGADAAPAAPGIDRHAWRTRVADAHRALIDAIDAALPRARVPAVLHDEHGHPRPVTLDLPICDAQGPVTPLREAA